MKKSFPQMGPSKIQTFNVLSCTHEMMVQLPHLKQLVHFCNVQLLSFKRCFSNASLTASELRSQLSGEHSEALNVMHCDEVLLYLSKSFNTFFLDFGGD